VQLRIEDGGVNDADGVSNGVILDPGGVAVIDEPAPTPTKADSKSGGGSGSMNLSILLLLVLTRQLLVRRRLQLGGK
jgi:hypothetical protein